MDTQKNTQALCFFEQEFAEKHNAFFSLKNWDKQGDFWTVPTNLSHDVYVFDSITSTLDKAHELSREREMHAFTTIVCQKQLSGRGQLRRKWESLQDNLYTAIVLPNTYPFNSEAAAPAFGAIAANALEKLGFAVELKWPNDIVQKTAHGYEKVGGILLEERNNTLVAGMGINVFSAPPNDLLRENFYISAGKLQNFSMPDRQREFYNYFNNSLFCSVQKNPENSFQYTDKIEEIDKIFMISGFCFALVKEINLWYKKNLISYNNTAWNSLCKKYLAFLGDTVCIKDALVKDSFYSGDIARDVVVGQIVGLGEEGELVLSSENGIIYIVGGSITK